MSGDLAVRLQPLFAIGLEVPALHIAFLNKVNKLGIHPGDLSFATSLMGTATALALYRRSQKATKRLNRDTTDDTAWIQLTWHLWKRS